MAHTTVAVSTVAQTRDELKAARRPLYDRCKQLHITHDAIAAEAHCHRTTVVQYFSGRRGSRAIELAIEKLIALVPIEKMGRRGRAATNGKGRR